MVIEFVQLKRKLYEDGCHAVMESNMIKYIITYLTIN